MYKDQVSKEDKETLQAISTKISKSIVYSTISGGLLSKSLGAGGSLNDVTNPSYLKSSGPDQEIQEPQREIHRGPPKEIHRLEKEVPGLEIQERQKHQDQLEPKDKDPRELEPRELELRELEPGLEYLQKEPPERDRGLGLEVPERELPEKEPGMEGPFHLMEPKAGGLEMEGLEGSSEKPGERWGLKKQEEFQRCSRR